LNYENWLKNILDRHSAIPVTIERDWIRVTVSPNLLPELVGALTHDWIFAGIVPENDPGTQAVRLLYVFYAQDGPWVGIEVSNHDQSVPTVSGLLFAADWQEREMEDLFDVHFEGHPQLGDFVLHDDHWPEGTAPMRRHSWEIHPKATESQDLSMPRIVEAPGSFVMPVGPVYSGTAESIQFHLETVGEEIVFAHIRPFYKYRAVEKILEGQKPSVALLIGERIDGLTAFAHSLALAQALETLAVTPVPPRAKLLRVFWAEFERIRSHIHVLAGILESTGLSVPASLMQALEENLLQVSGVSAGHRYLFGLNKLGGLSRDWSDAEIQTIVHQLGTVVQQSQRISYALAFDNSFLDRLESIGVLNRDLAISHGLVGPVARASGVNRDLRAWQEYAGYDQITFGIPVQSEGDGYARFRQLCQEIDQSSGIIQQIPPLLSPETPVASDVRITETGTAFGYVESPSGAIICGVSVNGQGIIERSRVVTPGLANWHAFPQAVRHFAFQDFPIILATFGLSVADLDR
jgi:Ni,Fe-hydrogenase III large subunit/Ni,Fe-hydrogenase III component G